MFRGMNMYIMSTLTGIFLLWRLAGGSWGWIALMERDVLGKVFW